MPIPRKVAYLLPAHEEQLVDLLERSKNEYFKWAKEILEEEGTRLSVGRMAQFIVLVLLQFYFGVPPGRVHAMLWSPFFSKVRAWIAGLDAEHPGDSTTYKHHDAILYHCGDRIRERAEKMQDTFQVEAGKASRELFTSTLDACHANMVPGPECFLGILAPSAVLSKFSVQDRGELIPFLNAWIYLQALRTTSTSEFIGMLKTAVMENDRVYFRLAGTLGFHRGPPGKNEIRTRLHQIEAIVGEANKDVNVELVKSGLMDLTTFSIDTTNIPVDKKDKTGSLGTGSRGTFFGHKEATATDRHCIPIAGTTHDGRQSDAITFGDLFDQAMELVLDTGQDTWAVNGDAGFSSPDIVDKIEGANAIAFIDVNSKRSRRLKAVATAGSALDELSTKAFESLTPEERQSWQDAVKMISAEHGEPVPLNKKKKLLSRLLKNLAAKARRRGLDAMERDEERRLRAELTRARRGILVHGTPAEKRLGLTTIPLGTIEWKLVYATRGQNEGINGNLKKRGSIIGDGQHTSWLHGAKVIGDRCNGSIVSIKVVALVESKITGKTSHCLERVHNWHRPKVIFVLVEFVIIIRATPDCNEERQP